VGALAPGFCSGRDAGDVHMVAVVAGYRNGLVGTQPVQD